MKKLGQYEILEELGRGGMGVVYKARQPSLNREVAVKILPDRLATDAELVERFLREARAAAGLDHPNIVTIHDVGQSGQTYFFAMQYLPGQTLEQMIREQGPLPVETAIEIARQLLDALGYAHQRGLIHRDIKPANVIMAADGRRPVITDFGIARAASETRMTRTGMIFGSPLYMSPEQLEGKEVDHRSDLYSLGALLYEILAGRPPYQSGAPVAVLSQRLREPIKSVRVVMPEVPEELDQVIRTMMAVEPDDRFPDAAAARLSLNSDESRINITATETDPVSPLPSTIIQSKPAPAPALAPTRLREPTPQPESTGDPERPGFARKSLPWLAALLFLTVATLTVVWFQPWNRLGSPKPTDRPGFTFTLGHTMGVSTISVDEKSEMALSTSYDGSAMLWNLETGHRLHTWREKESRIEVAALSPDGARVGLGCSDGTLKVLDITSGREIATISLAGRITRLQFPEDNDRLVSVDEGNVISSWDIGSGTGKTLLAEPSESLTVKALSDDGRLALTIDTRKQVGTTVWDLDTKTVINRYGGHGDQLLSAAFSTNGDLVLSGGLDGSLRLWESRTGRERGNWAGHQSSVDAIGFSHHGDRAVTGDSDGVIKLWDLSSKQPLFEVKTSVQVLAVRIAPDDRVIAGLVDGTIRILDPGSGHTLFNLGESADPTLALTFADDPRYLLAASGDSICRWDLETGEMFRPLTGHDGPVTALAVSPDGRLAISGSSDQTVRLWRMASGQELDQLRACTSPVTCAAFSPDGSRAVTGCGVGLAYFFEVSGERTLSVWDIGARDELLTIDLGESVPNCLAFTPDGTGIAVGQSCGLDGQGYSLAIHDPNSGRVTRGLTGQTGNTNSVAFTPDGQTLLAGSSDGSVRLWDVKTGRQQRVLNEPGPLGVNSVAISNNGRLAVAAQRTAFGEDDQPLGVRIWELATGQLVRDVATDRFGVTSLALSPDSRLLVTAGDNRTIRVHDLDSGRELAALVCFADGEWVSFTPDGYFNASPNGADRLDPISGSTADRADTSRQALLNPAQVRAALQGARLAVQKEGPGQAISSPGNQ